MATTQLNYQYAPPRAGFLAALTRVITVIYQGLERQRTRRQLATLDDRMLKDIGISRYEADIELRQRWWRYL